jgi:hypothetical protein
MSVQVVNLSVVDRAVSHSVARKVKDGAGCLSGEVARPSADHLLPKAPAKRVTIQDDKVHRWNIYALSENRVIAQDFDFTALKSSEQFGPGISAAGAVNAL